ncbi:hypothetical protein [Lacticaseibacillus hulanensis]|uniref:hypothetical protein n=1 Tax=Lacticaseibacillus hulanensis TaxID=2493111 RepID=UPI000FD6E15A|nr:hypothetical protein [Lacticaseibacillus hulanensis]
MSVRKAQILSWTFNVVLFFIYVFAMTIIGVRHSAINAILLVIVLSFGGTYSMKQKSRLLDQMWARADALGLSATDLSAATKYQGSIDLAMTRPENRKYFISNTDIRRIVKVLDDLEAHQLQQGHDDLR